VNQYCGRVAESCQLNCNPAPVLALFIHFLFALYFVSEATVVKIVTTDMTAADTTSLTRGQVRRLLLAEARSRRAKEHRLAFPPPLARTPLSNKRSGAKLPSRRPRDAPFTFDSSDPLWEDVENHMPENMAIPPTRPAAPARFAALATRAQMRQTLVSTTPASSGRLALPRTTSSTQPATAAPFVLPIRPATQHHLTATTSTTRMTPNMVHPRVGPRPHTATLPAQGTRPSSRRTTYANPTNR